MRAVQGLGGDRCPASVCRVTGALSPTPRGLLRTQASTSRPCSCSSLRCRRRRLTGSTPSLSVSPRSTTRSSGGPEALKTLSWQLWVPWGKGWSHRARQWGLLGGSSLVGKIMKDPCPKFGLIQPWDPDVSWEGHSLSCLGDPDPGTPFSTGVGKWPRGSVFPQTVGDQLGSRF